MVELLGAGGFGEVWLARHPTLHGLTAALKFCLDTAASSALRHEAALLDRVMEQGKHPGIVPLRQAYLDQEPLCLEYEYVNGGDLAALVGDWQRKGKIPLRQVNALVQRLAEIVAHAHKLSPPIVHRDLKPANILIERSRDNKIRLRVTDFGIGGVAAKQSLQGTRRGTTSRGEQLSTSLRGSYTPIYASPQQVKGEPPDPRDDVHALGVIWYQLLTGDLTAGIPADWMTVLQDLGQPEPLIRLLGVCVASRPEKRLANATVLCEKLSAELDASHMTYDLIPLLEEPVPNAAVPRPSAVARGKSQKKTATAERVAPSSEETAQSHSGTDESAKRRSLLIGALIGAAVIGLAFLGLGILLFKASGDKPNKDNQVAKSKTTSQTVKGVESVIAPGSVSHPDAETIPEVSVNSETKPKPGTGLENGPKIGPNNAAESEKYITNSIGMKLAFIPAGKFMMEQAKPEPEHYVVIGRRPVTIMKPFYMGVYEVTQKEFVAVMNSNPSQVFIARGNVGWDWPVEGVSWDEANTFCDKLSALPAEKRAGRVYRLPTEAEWEYAYRAGSSTSHYFDPRKANEYGWTKANSDRKLHPVGQLKPNAWGLYDMNGNVWEWCADKQDGKWHEAWQGWGRVLRGAAFTEDVGFLRHWQDPSKRVWVVGFRLVCNQL